GTVKFAHSDEKAEPGFYSVRLQNGILAELTATKRVGFHRYTFPRAHSGSDRSPNITFGLRWRDKTLESQMTQVRSRRLEGFRRSSSWAKDQKVYFVAEFSEPFSDPIHVDGASV